MSDLAFITLICGTLIFVWNIGMALWPQGTAAFVGAFPRHVWAGRILAAADILWSAWLLLQMRFAWVDAHQILVYAAVPVAFVLVILFVDDLLAARALGGFMLLVPLPMLESAFVHPCMSRLVMTTFAYLLAIFGIVLVWSPFKLRQWTERWIRREPIARAVGVVGLIVGSVMLVLGWRVY
ncbi:MAG: hypothetical protein PHW60_11515 [Kiritimatiellae bacterium]|nr:hypothetical protein [Kiritimatiellia bacterium]